MLLQQQQLATFATLLPSIEIERYGVFLGGMKAMFGQRNSTTLRSSEEEAEKAWVDKLLQFADRLLHPLKKDPADEDQQSEPPKAA